MLNGLKKLAQSQSRDLLGLVVVVGLIWLIRYLVFYGTSVYRMLWLWIPLTVLTIISFVLWYLYKRNQEKKGHERTKALLQEDARAALASAHPQAKADLEQIEKNFQYAIELLESSVSKRERSTVLYTRPWLLVVGPPSDGKSTSILNAGVQWPMDPRIHETGGGGRDGPKVDGMGGTITCNWFFGKEAIILDTAGRWQSRDMGEIDEEQWKSFLEMLKESRSKRPINGIIALCSVKRLLTDDKELQRRAQETRNQIEEIMNTLETHAPVYLVINKCDLIHGFVEFFADLDKLSRNQIWGFTRKYKPRVRTNGNGLESELQVILDDYEYEMDRLQKVLDERRLHRLLDPDLDSSQQSALFVFPSEFNELRTKLKEFVEIAFRENPLGHNPALRGVYFTSATQVGQLIFEGMKQAFQEFDFPTNKIPSPIRQIVDAYFLRDLFHKVIFKDDRLAGRFKRSHYDRTRWSIIGASAFAAVLVGLWMGISYFVNSAKNENLANQVRVVRDTGRQTSVPEYILPKLDSLRILHKDYLDVGWPFGVFHWLFGRGDRDTLSDVARVELAEKMDNIFVDRTIQECESILIMVPSSSSNLLQYVSAYRAYMYLTMSPFSQNMDHRGVADFVVSTAVQWFPKEEQEKSLRIMLDSLFTEYWTIYKYSPRDPPNHDILQKAESNLKGYWSWQRIARNLLDGFSDTAKAYQPNRRDYFGAEATVPFKFTSNGWRKLVRPKFMEALDFFRNDTVLNDVIASELQSGSMQEMQELYCVKCKRSWWSFFDRLTLDHDPGAMDDFYIDLMRPVSPIIDMVKEITEITQFNIACLDNYFVGFHTFTDSGSPKYTRSVAKVANSVLEQSNLMGDCLSAYRETQSNMRLESLTVESLLQEYDIPLEIQKFLKKPFNRGRRDSKAIAVQCINGSWRQTVLRQVSIDDTDCFPFTSRSNAADCDNNIRTFLGDGGPIEEFKDQFWNDVIQFPGISFTRDYQDFEDNRARIMDLLNGEDIITIVLKASTVGEGINQVTVNVGSNPARRFSFSGDVEVVLPKAFDVGNTIRIKAELTDQSFIDFGQFSGPMSALKLLDRARAHEGHGSLSNGTFRVGFDVNASSNHEPLTAFKGFQFPETVCR